MRRVPRVELEDRVIAGRIALADGPISEGRGQSDDSRDESCH